MVGPSSKAHSLKQGGWYAISDPKLEVDVMSQDTMCSDGSFFSVSLIIVDLDNTGSITHLSVYSLHGRP